MVTDEFGLGHQLSFTDLFRLSLRIFKTKPVRTILTIMGMSVGIGTVVFLVSLGYGLQFILIGKLVTTEDSLISLGVSYPTESNLNIDRAKISEINSMEDVNEISPVAEFTGAENLSGETEGPTGDVIVKIIKPSYFRLSGIAPDIGASLKEEEAAVVVTNQAAKLINVTPDISAINKNINLKIYYQDLDQMLSEEINITKELPIRGIINDDSQPTIFISDASLPKEPPFYKELVVKAASVDVVERLRDALISKGFLISARVDLVNQAKKVMNIITIVMGVFGVAALIVSAIGMFNTMIVGFLERIYEVGIMKSLGATDRDVKNLFLMESFLMGFLGGAGGVLIGAGGGKIFNILLSAFAQHFGGKSLALFITPWWFIAMTLALSAFIGVVSGFWPAYRASYLSPKEAFKNR